MPLTAPLLRLASADTSSTWAALGTRREEACVGSALVRQQNSVTMQNLGPTQCRLICDEIE